LTDIQTYFLTDIDVFFDRNPPGNRCGTRASERAKKKKRKEKKRKEKKRRKASRCPDRCAYRRRTKGRKGTIGAALMPPNGGAAICKPGLRSLAPVTATDSSRRIKDSGLTAAPPRKKTRPRRCLSLAGDDGPLFLGRETTQ
jgi:hypothetical protein